MDIIWKVLDVVPDLSSQISFLPRKPNLAIAEHVWPGLVKKELTFGGK